MFDVANYQIRGMLAAFDALGLPAAELAREAGVDASLLVDPDVRFSERAFLQLWLHGEARWTGPLLSLQAAAAVPFGAFELLDYLVGSGARVADVFAQLARYAQLCTSGLTYQITTSDAGAVVAMCHPYLFEAGPPGLGEYAWALIVARLRRRLGSSFRPTLRLRHAPRGPIALYRELLGEVCFECPHAELHLSPSQWTTENPAADAGLATFLQRYADQAIANLLDHSDTLQLVRQQLAKKLRAGEPTLEELSRILALTPRTLQRRLAEHGYTFKSLLGGLRVELARSYLAQPRLSLSDIAFLLGYSDPSAFSRAFRRWTGHTPGDFREAQQHVAGDRTVASR